MLAFAFAEGTGNDWISVALIDGYGTSRVVGILGFATFLAAMTAGRWFGPELLDRYGRVAVLPGDGRPRASSGCCCSSSAGHPALAFVGAVLWGAGLSLGFPVGMSAGADDPAHAASRVSVIASVGYLRLPRRAAADRLPRRARRACCARSRRSPCCWPWPSRSPAPYALLDPDRPR